jgi:hypothetical protein
MASWKTIRTHSADVWRPSLGSANELLAHGLTRPLSVVVSINCFSNSSIFSHKEMPFVSNTVFGSTANAREDKNSKKRKNMLDDWFFLYKEGNGNRRSRNDFEDVGGTILSTGEKSSFIPSSDTQASKFCSTGRMTNSGQQSRKIGIIVHHHNVLQIY